MPDLAVPPAIASADAPTPRTNVLLVEANAGEGARLVAGAFWLASDGALWSAPRGDGGAVNWAAAAAVECDLLDDEVGAPLTSAVLAELRKGDATGRPLWETEIDYPLDAPEALYRGLTAALTAVALDWRPGSDPVGEYIAVPQAPALVWHPRWNTGGLDLWVITRHGVDLNVDGGFDVFTEQDIPEDAADLTEYAEIAVPDGEDAVPLVVLLLRKLAGRSDMTLDELVESLANEASVTAAYAAVHAADAAATEPPVVLERIAAPAEDWWICACGNEPDGSGFYPCDAEGRQVEPDHGTWDGKLSVCADCGRIIDQTLRDEHTGRVAVVGRRPGSLVDLTTRPYPSFAAYALCVLAQAADQLEKPAERLVLLAAAAHADAASNPSPKPGGFAFPDRDGYSGTTCADMTAWTGLPPDEVCAAAEWLDESGWLDKRGGQSGLPERLRIPQPVFDAMTR